MHFHTPLAIPTLRKTCLIVSLVVTMGMGPNAWAADDGNSSGILNVLGNIAQALQHNGQGDDNSSDDSSDMSADNSQGDNGLSDGGDSGGGSQSIGSPAGFNAPSGNSGSSQNNPGGQGLPWAHHHNGQDRRDARNWDGRHDERGAWHERQRHEMRDMRARNDFHQRRFDNNRQHFNMAMGQRRDFRQNMRGGMFRQGMGRQLAMNNRPVARAVQKKH